MTVEKQIKEFQDRLEKVRQWQSRLDNLAGREIPMSESQFCEKHGFHKASFNRNKKSPETGKDFPTRRTVEKVEKAFKKERV